MLEVKGLEVAYGGIRAVKGIDLAVGEGELVTLIGPETKIDIHSLSAADQKPRARDEDDDDII